MERGGTTPSERLAVAMRAAKCYEQAERLVRTGDFQLAERLLYRAIADDGEQPMYLVLLAWCQAEALAIRPPPPGQLTDALDAQLRMLQKALRNEPNDARARYYFAQLLKRSGRIDGAMHQLEIVLNLQPHNIGAGAGGSSASTRCASATRQRAGSSIGCCGARTSGLRAARHVFV